MENVNAACLLVQGCLYNQSQRWTVFTVWCLNGGTQTITWRFSADVCRYRVHDSECTALPNEKSVNNNGRVLQYTHTGKTWSPRKP